MKKKFLLLSIAIIISFLIIQPIVFAHQSGCHRWHSCPSDTGSYICGDTGYCSGCPDNEYCKDGSPITTSPTTSSPTSIEPTTPTPEENETEFIPQQITIEPGEITEINVTIPVECKGTFKGLIERIIDGDTLVVNGCNEDIRLSLVNTPEYYQNDYEEAKSFTESLCEVGSIATIDQDSLQPYDRYGRIVAVVYCQNKNLNAELIYNNLAVIDIRFCSTSEFVNEDWAKNYGCQISKPSQIEKSLEKIPTTSEQSSGKTQTTTQPSNKGVLDIFIEFIMSLFRL